MEGKKERDSREQNYKVRWIWNGSPESFFHPRDVDWDAIASSLWEIWGVLRFFMGKIDLSRSYGR